MHIPDAALSPATALVTTTAMVPVWYAAGRRLRATLATRRVPLLALGAAFCFTLMMFNVPVPGGTTVHATGGVLMAVVLGPWATVIGMTVTLVIQALLFADGGVLAVGANCLAMAFAAPFVGYAAYRLAAGRCAPDSPRRVGAAGVGAYFGINAAALVVAVILGVQPLLYHDAGGRALYFPFGLAITIPAMMVSHLTVAGVAEAAVTALAIRYLLASRIPLDDDAAERGAATRWGLGWLWLALAAIIALTPLGLLAKGTAWGEWSPLELAAKAGYLPSGFASTGTEGSGGFRLLPDYLREHGGLAYVLAALAGVAIVVLLALVLGRLLARRAEGRRAEVSPPADGAPPAEGLPAWLVEKESPGGKPASERGAGRGRGFVERTLHDLATSAKSSLLAEQWSRRDGMLQRLDPRGKIVALLGFVVLTSFVRSAPVLAVLAGLACLLAVSSRIPPVAFLRRVWLAVPLAVGAVTLPASLSIVTPGPAALVLLREPEIAVTWPGLATAGLLALRVGTAISFVTLLAMTTPWNDLMHGLRVLFVPRIFVTVLSITYRYLGVLASAAADMFLARKSRTVGRAEAGSGRGFVGSVAGGLLGKTLAMSDDVHAAMLSRGWSGEARALRPLRMRATDVVWLGAMMALALAAAGWAFLG